MDYNFPAIMTETHRWEGGYVNHPEDPGGSTNMGVTQGTLDAARRSIPGLPKDVRNLTVAQAEKIYYPKYWVPVKGPELPSGLDHVAFDGAVNSGPSRGAKWLQTGIGATPDGVVGPKTLKTAKGLPGYEIGSAITRSCDARRGFLRGLRIFATFGKGWMRRVDGVEAHAHRLAKTSRPAAKAAKQRAVREDKAAAGGAAGTGVGAGAASYGDIFAGVPWWALTAAGVVIGLVLLNLVGRAMIDRRREKEIVAVADKTL